MPGGHEVDDVLQETFLTITAKADGFEKGTNFTAWATTIARFKVMEFFRKSGKRELLLGDETLELFLDEAPGDPVTNGRLEALKRCLGKLSPNVRQMLAQRYAEGWKPEKIASEIGWGANSVYVSLSRARTTLRECIQKWTEGGPA
jgi:RNA polymerase sigma-70 factor (ECF subfamily)